LRLFILTFITITVLFGDKLELESRILVSILKNLQTNEKKIIYSDDKKLLKLLDDNFITTDDLDRANFLLLRSKRDYRGKKYIFTLNYQLLREIPQSIGAFFFKKGRANVILIKSRMKKLNIKTTKQLKPYIEEELW